jgi:uncharacterized protein (DUF1697 family)
MTRRAPIFVVLLRAVNLGRSRRVPMADLREALDGAGYGQVTTYLQSGNVILASAARSDTKLGSSIERLMRATFGFDVGVIVRAASHMNRVVRTNPLARPPVSPTSLHVAFLKTKPSASVARKLADLDFGRDEFVLRGSELFLRYPKGVARSKMSAALFERLLDTPATMRTWKVVNELARRAEAARSG